MTPACRPGCRGHRRSAARPRNAQIEWDLSNIVLCHLFIHQNVVEAGVGGQLSGPGGAALRAALQHEGCAAAGLWEAVALRPFRRAQLQRRRQLVHCGLPI